MKTLLLTLVLALTASAQLTVHTDKPVFVAKESIVLHVNSFDELGEYISVLFKVTIDNGKSPAYVTWASTYPDRDSYLVFYFKQKGNYAVSVETVDGTDLVASTSFIVR